MRIHAVTFLVTFVLWWTCSVLSQCPTNWRRYKEHCYYFSNDYQSWQRALHSCYSKGGLLASIWDRNEQNWVRSQFPRNAIWIGLWRAYQYNSEWKWVDGTLYFQVVSQWGPGPLHEKPSSGYCTVITQSGWYTKDCDRYLAYICKRPVDETPSLACPKCPDLTCPALPNLTCPALPKCPDLTCPALPNLTCPALPTSHPPHYPLTSTTAPPTNREPEICTSSASGMACSSHNVTCSCMLPVLANSKGGFRGALDDGLSVNRSIVIRGRAYPKAETLIVNLLGRDLHPDDDATALHLRFNFESRTVVLNSMVDGSWGEKRQENFPEQRPFGPGLDFKIVIWCDADTFRLTFNDIHQMDHKYQIQDLRSIKWLEVWSALLTSIQLM
ncbi:uncharacterized protein LOC144040877 [Vanacampus margaritifer]